MIAEGLYYFYEFKFSLYCSLPLLTHFRPLPIHFYLLTLSFLFHTFWSFLSSSEFTLFFSTCSFLSPSLFIFLHIFLLTLLFLLAIFHLFVVPPLPHCSSSSTSLSFPLPLLTFPLFHLVSTPRPAHLSLPNLSLRPRFSPALATPKGSPRLQHKSNTNGSLSCA